MTNYQEALKIVLDNIRVFEAEVKPLLSSFGQVLAEDIYSDYSLPLKDQSGQDGYAVISADIQGASNVKPVALQIIEIVKAGHLPKRTVEPGTAIRIMTGAVIPKGADCVVRFEDTDEPADKNGPNKDNPSIVKIFVANKPGNSINKAGANVRQGFLILSKGTVLGPAQISVLTNIGKAEVKVIRRPVIAVISTGDELIKLGQPLVPGKSFDSNTAVVAALVAHYGGIPKILGIARDNEKSILTKLLKGLKLDVVITSGGVAKGDYDLIRKVIGKMGGQVLFSKISMGPGASVAFCIVNKTCQNDELIAVPVFALAGPPAGCMINFETLVRPALLKMIGIEEIGHPVIQAVTRNSSSNKMAMTFVRWTKLEKSGTAYEVAHNQADKIGALVAIANADSLTIIPQGTAVTEGDQLQVLPLDWCRNRYVNLKVSPESLLSE